MAKKKLDGKTQIDADATVNDPLQAAVDESVDAQIAALEKELDEAGGDDVHIETDLGEEGNDEGGGQGPAPGPVVDPPVSTENTLLLEDGARVDCDEHQFRQWRARDLNGTPYEHVGEAPDGEWIYRNQ